MKKDNKKLYFLIIILFVIVVIFIGIKVAIHFFYNNASTNAVNIDFEEQNSDSNELKKEKDDNDNKENETENKSINEKQDEEESKKSSTVTNNNFDGNNLESSDSRNSSIINNKVTTGTSEPNEDAGDFEINDKQHVWSKTTEIKIFDKDKVSPGDTGEYEFTINNNTIGNVKYKIEFNEINKYKVNMMYKLSRNNEFIAGNEDEWVYYDKLNVEEKVLNKKNNDVYKIEWKWVDADNDTQVGRTKGANYTIKVLVKAEETQEVDKSANWWNNPRTGDNIVYAIIVAILSSIILILLIILKRQKDSDNVVKKD